MLSSFGGARKHFFSKNKIIWKTKMNKLFNSVIITTCIASAIISTNVMAESTMIEVSADIPLSNFHYRPMTVLSQS